jgi:hypothetical protein
MKKIPCLFCNKKISFSLYSQRNIEGGSAWCQKCNANYNIGDSNIYFSIRISNKAHLFYNVSKYTCEIFLGPDQSENHKKIIFPMDKFLLPLLKLKEKVNNIITYI